MENEEKTANEVEEKKVDEKLADKPVDNIGGTKGVDPKQVLPKMREIVIQTDGSNVNLSKNETFGVLELSAILRLILEKITSQR